MKETRYTEEQIAFALRRADNLTRTGGAILMSDDLAGAIARITFQNW